MSWMSVGCFSAILRLMLNLQYIDIEILKYSLMYNEVEL